MVDIGELGDIAETLEDCVDRIHALMAVLPPKPEPPNSPEPEPKPPTPAPMTGLYEFTVLVGGTLGIVHSLEEGEFFVSAQPSWNTTLGVQFDQNDVMITFGDKPPTGAKIRIVLSGEKHGNAG